MKLITAISMSLVSLSAVANSCDDVVRVDSVDNVIYVVCPSLPSMNKEDLAQATYKIIIQKNFNTDVGFIINFIYSKKELDRVGLTSKNHLGEYFSDSNNFILWPKDKSKRNEVQLRI
ncbi:hypothetical protein [Microbulbifer sp. SAOS-129_SWC]|uniref:hypothetical protein n=1 Tax=Microbulbifer sp. SAOS-129_SWC TaxID=3145235 RepID=UPI00321776E3